MTVVDAHCHAARYWREPVEDLLEHMRRARVDRAVLTCAVYAMDSDYEQECVRRYPDRFSFVGAVHPGSAHGADEVRSLAAAGAAGVRLQAPDAGASTDREREILRAAAECDITVSLFGRSADFNSPGFVALLDEFPNVRLVIEHLASHNRPGEENEDDRRKAFGLGRYPGVHLKFHGLGEFCLPKHNPFVPFPFQEPIPPYLDWAYDAFGPQRLLWGSNFPIVCSQEGYEKSLTFSRAHFARLGSDELGSLFGGNALRLFPSGRRTAGR